MRKEGEVKRLAQSFIQSQGGMILFHRVGVALHGVGVVFKHKTPHSDSVSQMSLLVKGCDDTNNGFIPSSLFIVTSAVILLVVPSMPTSKDSSLSLVLSGMMRMARHLRPSPAPRTTLLFRSW